MLTAGVTVGPAVEFGNARTTRGNNENAERLRSRPCQLREEWSHPLDPDRPCHNALVRPDRFGTTPAACLAARDHEARVRGSLACRLVRQLVRVTPLSGCSERSESGSVSDQCGCASVGESVVVDAFVVVQREGRVPDLERWPGLVGVDDGWFVRPELRAA